MSVYKTCTTCLIRHVGTNHAAEVRIRTFFLSGFSNGNNAQTDCLYFTNRQRRADFSKPVSFDQGLFVDSLSCCKAHHWYFNVNQNANILWDRQSNPIIQFTYNYIESNQLLGIYRKGPGGLQRWNEIICMSWIWLCVSFWSSRRAVDWICGWGRREICWAYK